MSAAAAAALLALVALGPFVGLWVAAKLRPRRRSKLASVAHSLHGPYRRDQVRMFATVDGKTTELRHVRSLEAPLQQRATRAARSMRRRRVGDRPDIEEP